MALADGYDGFLFDLDGVLWLGSEPIPGAAEAVAGLIDAGKGAAFLTNNPRAGAEDYAARLRGEGIEVGPERVVTAGAVTAALAAASPAALRGAYVIGTDSFRREVADAGASLLDGDGGEEAGVVVVSGHAGFDYGELRIATAALLRGAKLFATNRDPTMPMPGRSLARHRLDPGGGRDGLGGLRDGWREAPAADLRARAGAGGGLPGGDGGRPPRLRHRGRGGGRAGDDPRPHRLHRAQGGAQLAGAPRSDRRERRRPQGLMARPLWIGVALAAPATAAACLGASPATAADRDCSDFPNQRAAQSYFIAKGGPAARPRSPRLRRRWHRLRDAPLSLPVRGRGRWAPAAADQGPHRPRRRRRHRPGAGEAHPQT